MRTELATEVDVFERRAAPWLGRLDCNVMATVLMNIRERGLASRFGWSEREDGALAALALRTHPWPLLLVAEEPRAIAPLLERWLTDDPSLPGVSGPPAATRTACEAWTALTGGRTALRMSEAMHVLDEVIEPVRPSPGSLRLAELAERELVSGWWREFALEAGMQGAEQASAIVDAAMARGGLVVWEHDGRPVSLIGVNRRVAGVVRIGPVYTPPDLRRRGYATTAVAAASRRALDAGAARCMLFTDLANPTSNKIYAEVGYRRVGDWEEHNFLARV